MNMNLQEFIKTTLVEVSNGLREANSEFAKQEGKELGKDASIKFLLEPASWKREKDAGYINFDIALTVSKEESSKIGGGANIIVVSSVANTENSDIHQSISRIKFKVASDVTIC